MSSLNKVTLIGNVGKDPEIRAFQNGDEAAEFSVATSESWKDKATGEKKEKTEWHNVSVTNQGLVKIVKAYVKKGTKIYIEGKLETQKYTDKQGVERYTTKIMLKPFNGEIVLLGGNGEKAHDAPVSNHDTAKADGYASVPFDDSDDIPF
jgi:single-strand DNA-binding protein